MKAEEVNMEEKLRLIRERMPMTYAAVKAKADEIGKDAYSLVRRGLRGEANCFYAIEAGHVMGTPFAEDLEIMDDVRRWMVCFGASFVIIWPRSHAPDGSMRVHGAFQPGAANGVAH